MDKTIIIIGLFAVILILIIAAIFAPSFQKLVLGGEAGEAKVAGIITVRGVTFALIVLGCAGLATYLGISGSDKASDMNIDGAIHFLEEYKKDNYSISSGTADSLVVRINTRLVGSMHSNLDLSYRKSNEQSEKYRLMLDETALEDLKLDLNPKSDYYSDGDIYRIDVPYKISGTQLWFEILDITSVPSERGNVARYEIKFGEGSSEGNIQWIDGKFNYGKTNNGETFTRMEVLRREGWRYDYVVAFGAGMYGSDGEEYINYINISLVEIALN